MAGLAITLNVGWIILNWRRLVPMVLGIPFFGLLIAGVILNTIFLVREVRRNERHDSFLNAVTHELKTPIASIRLYLETLQRRTLTEEQRQEFYGIMLQDSGRLLATVEQVLKAGEVGHKPKDHARSSIEIKALATDCIAMTLQRHHLPAGAITLDIEEHPIPFFVRGNAEDIQTAVLNLLDNAIKYSPPGAPVQVQLAMEDDAWIMLRVKDEGLGIRPAHLKRIFRRFYRVPTRASLKRGGTGLGLFLVRSIARQHGGDATALSDGEGKGSTFCLRLPRMLSPKLEEHT